MTSSKIWLALFLFCLVWPSIHYSESLKENDLNGVNLDYHYDVITENEQASSTNHGSHMSVFQWAGEALKIQLKLRQMGRTFKLRDFSFRRLLGSGTYGDVYLAKPKGTLQFPAKTLVAVKFYKTDGEDCLREYYFQTIFQDQQQDPLVSNMIHAYGAIRYLPENFSVNDTRYYHAVFYEFVPFSLSELIKKKYVQASRSLFVKVISYKVLKACLFLERHRIIHFDLKPGNFMVKPTDDFDFNNLSFLQTLNSTKSSEISKLIAIIDSFQIKMIDFGMSADLNSEKYGISTYRQYRFGTGKYRPFEAYLGSLALTFAYDIWSIGIMLFEFAMGTNLFGGIGKMNHSIIPVLQAIYFPEPDQKGFPTNVDIPGIEQLPAYYDTKLAYDRVIAGNDLSALEGRLISRYREDNVVKRAENVLDPKLYDLLMSLLRLDPAKRLTASSALNHPFFDDIKDIYH